MLASALLGLGAGPRGGRGISLSPVTCLSSPLTVGFLRGGAGGEEPGDLAPAGGRGTEAGASQIFEDPLDALALPAGAGRCSRRSASSCSSESGAGGPGAMVELSSREAGT